MSILTEFLEVSTTSNYFWSLKSLMTQCWSILVDHFQSKQRYEDKFKRHFLAQFSLSHASNLKRDVIFYTERSISCMVNGKWSLTWFNNSILQVIGTYVLKNRTFRVFLRGKWLFTSKITSFVLVRHNFLAQNLFIFPLHIIILALKSIPWCD